MIMEKLYTIEEVAVLPKGLDTEALARFIKETQSYEWAMCQAKNADALSLLKERLEETPSLYRFTKPLSLLGLELNLAYLDVSRDTSRPMMTNYHKNQVTCYKSGSAYKLYLNGQPFLSLNEEASDALLAFTLKEATLYYKGRYFASGEDLGIILASDELFKLVLHYTYLNEALVLPSYQAYEAMERLRRTSYASLNKRFELFIDTSDSASSLAFLTSHNLTKTNQVKTCVDTMVILSTEAEDIEAWQETYEKVAGKDARVMKVSDERDMMIAMSRDIEVIFLDEALLDTFFMYLPNWRTKKITYLLRASLKNAPSLWQKLEHRSEKERSMALYFREIAEEKTSMVEVG